MYYYALNGQQAGPVPEDQLRGMVSTGSLAPDTLIWREGMAEWQPFSVALGGGAPAVVQCSVCHQMVPLDQTIKYGATTVCASCKPRFMQGLREGAQVTTLSLVYSGFWRRVGAKFLDGIILWVVMLITNIPLSGGISFLGPGMNPNASMGLVAGLTLLNYLVGLSYVILFLKFKGQTLGRMALKIKVVRPDGSGLSWGQAIGRPFAEFLSACILYIGYLMMLWDPEKRCLHDRLAGTRVIRVD